MSKYDIIKFCYIAHLEIQSSKIFQSDPQSPLFAVAHSLGWGTLSWNLEPEIWYPRTGSICSLCWKSGNLSSQGILQSAPNSLQYFSHSSTLLEDLINLRKQTLVSPAGTSFHWENSIVNLFWACKNWNTICNIYMSMFYTCNYVILKI